MGRRSTRRIDPDLDLSHHLDALEDVPQPLDPARWFGRAAALEIEIGSGKGLFLARAAETHPDRDYVGLEIAGKYARLSAARLARRRLTNARMIHGDAQRFVREWLGDRSVAAVHVYFPDPWWKKRHRKRRVMNARLLEDVQRVLEPRGRLHFWTDVREYFDATVELIRAATTLEGPLDVPETAAAHDLDYRTHFERRMRLHSVPVYRAEFRRPERDGSPDTGRA